MDTVIANTTSRGRGRPRLASRLLLEEAAFELFLEQGYAQTSIDDIAQRSGVSRNTFFNYFEAKSDVFWVEIDAALATLHHNLSQTPSTISIGDALEHALMQCAETLEAGSVPWILSNFETIGSPPEVMESAMQRLSPQAAIVRTFVGERLGMRERELLPQLISNLTLAAAVSAALAWGQAGTLRHPLRTYLSDAFVPLRAGLPESGQSNS